MLQAHISGFPRIGERRELKTAVEAFWQNRSSIEELETVGRRLRQKHWNEQSEAGMDLVAVGDFAFYDHMLDTMIHLGALPSRFDFRTKSLTLAQSFELARGNLGNKALEMTKWFDTNYHYLVPELDGNTAWDGEAEGLVREIREACQAGHRVKAVLTGPLTFLFLSKWKGGGGKPDALKPLTDTYARLLLRLQEAGAEWLQFDEPILALDLDATWRAAFPKVYSRLDARNLLLSVSFGPADHHRELIDALPVAGVHLDLVRGAGQMDGWLSSWPADRILSAGVIDGRNVWRNDLDRTLGQLRPLHGALGDRLWIGASCSLLHVPVDLENETRLDPELKSWLAFAKQKLQEIAALKEALSSGESALSEQTKALFSASRLALDSRSASKRIYDEAVREQAQALSRAQRGRSPYTVRAELQQKRFNLPAWPTTTIGSFPQTKEIRALRASAKKGGISPEEYRSGLRDEIRRVVRFQEETGLDVLVHGEPERNDMVEFFAEFLAGYAFSDNGWVQSYGSRCVKPPLLFGDVKRLAPMTVDWTVFAQSLTTRPMKGMLTGPVTMLQWTFCREDLDRGQIALQIAAALRQEIADLERSGIGIIQVDEPAFREGLPLREKDQAAYWDWAVKAFHAAVGAAGDGTQIHTHMCYSDFSGCLDRIAAMDADVITIETARSAMELLEHFGHFDYPNAVGPGIWDIHSPVVPSQEEMLGLLKKAAQVLPPGRLWINPDCGLKTRSWPEVQSALDNLVATARGLRGSKS